MTQATRFFVLVCLIGSAACSTPSRSTKDTWSQNKAPPVEEFQNFSLDDDDSYEMPEQYTSRFDGTLSDIGNKTPVEEFAENQEDANQEPDIDFIEELNPEESMAMFGDSSDTKHIFYVKTTSADVFRLVDQKKKVVKLLKRGQRIRATLENGKAKIGTRYYMSLSDLSLTPVRGIRNVRATQK